MEKYFLQLSTFPACSLGLIGFRKEVLKVGHYVKESTNQEFDITSKILDDLVVTFDKWIAEGNKCPVPLGHERAHLPEFNRGWVRSLFREEDSLYAIMELSDPELALTTDVSVCIESEVTDGHGITYKNVLSHIALTCEPVVGKLHNFLRLSLSKGTKNMDILKKLAIKLGLKEAEPTEELVLSALDELKKPDDKVTLSTNVDPLVRLIGDNREMKLSNLVKAGLITPAIKDLIAAKYVKAESVALELSKGDSDGFDLLHDVLVQNRPVKLGEVTGIQSLSLELANPSAGGVNHLKVAVDKLNEATGHKTS